MQTDNQNSREGSQEPQRRNRDEPGRLQELRFVVQHHLLADSHHWDLMFERGGVLATWRSPCPLSEISAAPVAIEQIGEHRLAYLTYEGPVSGDRGRVQIDERGEYLPLSRTAREWRLRVRGERTRAFFRLQKSSAGPADWLISKEATEDARA